MSSGARITSAGGCHCGAVRFEIETAEHVELLDCNCSICTKTGYLHLIVPEGDFHLLSGEDALQSYRFGTGKAQHLFCKVCGIKSFYRPRSHPESVSVHFGCLDPGHAISAQKVAFDGRNWEQAKSRLDSKM